MEPARPWSSAAVLARVLAAWRQQYAGRDLYRVAAGPGWLRLHLAGDEHAALLLAGLPGARLILDHTGPLPAPLMAALPAARSHPVSQLLNGGRLLDCGLLPADRVVALRLQDSRGHELVLLHQLFGAQGNTVLLDRRSTLLWGVHRPPHAALSAWPPPDAFTAGDLPPPPDDYRVLALAQVTATLAEQAAAANRARLARRIKTGERLVDNLADDFARADQGDTYRRKAEALAANLGRLRQGMALIELADLRDAAPLTIALDPARNPAANLEAWFKRARKADRGLAVITGRLAAARAELAQLELADAALNAIAPDPGDPAIRLAAHQAWRADWVHLLGSAPDIREPGSRCRGREQPTARPFRRYLIDGQWEVWVGRNNRENDELTHRASHTRDIWLHAQGVSGSHVILRTGGQPERVPAGVLAKAAALAALHSKARHSQLVPVIHTERRYVRRPRKAPPGTAICLRDESLFVEPGVMNGVAAV